MAQVITKLVYSYADLPDGELEETEETQVKDIGGSFVTTSITVKNVGEKDNYRDGLQDERDGLETTKVDLTDQIDDEIDKLNDRITEIDAL